MTDSVVCSLQAAGRQVAHLVEALRREVPGQPHAAALVAEVLVAGGHVLLEGLPGSGKSALARALCRHVDLDAGTVSMTPDMIPADILGTEVLEADPRGRLRRVDAGALPLAHNLVVVDGLNRGTPRTQSALLEAMQEHAVTLGGTRHALPEPFMVLACQVPPGLEGTYPLAESALDRFSVHVRMRRLDSRTLQAVLGAPPGDSSEPMPVDELLEVRRLCDQVVVTPSVLDYAARLVAGTSPGADDDEIVSQSVVVGAGPRAVQDLVRLARVRAARHGRVHVSRGDISELAPAVVAHRLSLSMAAVGGGRTPQAVVRRVVGRVDRLHGRA